MTKLLEIDELDLEPIIIKAMDKNEGKGWVFTYACEIADEYRKFLMLCKKYPKQGIVPCSLVDEFWHFHILDTQKYAKDCEQFIGYFLHHFPYFGMRGEEDAKNLDEAFENTKRLYKSQFGVEYICKL